ncbi:MAG: hypothetical protein QM726_10600 [Chitinophagaceae bacterium]
MIRNKSLFAAMVLAILLSSCYSSRKAKINEAVNTSRQLQDQEAAAINEIQDNLGRQLELGNVDSSILKRVNASLADNRALMDSIKRTMDDLIAKTVDRKTLRSSYKTIIKSKLVYLSNDRLLYQQRAVNYGMVADVLKNTKQSQFDLATFFGPGEFLIPADKLQQATSAFEPVIDVVIKFAAKYPDLSKNATIVLKGYADAQGVKQGTPLYYRLSNEIPQVEKPTNTELNLALSKLRTESINEIVNKILQKKQPELLQQKIIHVELVQEGRGEEKPNPKINDYTDNDPRRRIVLFFWSLLPV